MRAILERSVEIEGIRMEEPVDGMRLMVRHRKLVGVVAAIAAAVATVAAMLLPPTYTATARLLPPQQSQSLAALFVGQTGNSPLAAMAQKDLGLKNPADLYIGVLNSRSVQDGLTKQFELATVYGLKRPSDVRARLVDRTRIQLTKEGLISVSVEDRDANRAAGLANGYAEQLRLATKRLAISEAAQRRKFFDEQVQQTRDELARAETTFREVQEKTGILQLDAQGKALIETAATLRAEIAAGEVQLRAMRSFGTEQNPDVRQQEAQLGGWRAELAQLESRRMGDGFSKGRAPADAQEYVQAMREVRYREAMLEMLLRQLEAAKLDEAKEATIVQVVDVAVPPDVRTSPKRAAVVVFSTLGAVLATAVWLQLRQRFLTDVAWQERWSGLRKEWGP
ncbi:lipopolysaccharide biosynthesis [Candidatus Koribacter versatilis Ellin345]|uniref:Lipopolysaccharide biosynthesis n=1 Tax=Koribacter versatilis (strain Ellin345) TaxID=204669 RepID=Q1IN18_KORVE|nr:Wzz/FepE/Etk N-terminal domain-containing protein [Candidatus Koribacter versatilis]ABF41732.1 lipopolysaccharide biosynthesis [Candidatus Koribacter versatilis Ellin345]